MSLLWGLGGVGKTALALHTIRTRFPERVAHTLFVGWGGAGPAHEPLLEVLRVILKARGVRLDWRELLADADLLLSTMIDCVEEAGYWVLLDEWRHEESGGRPPFLAELSRYARESRWIVTARADPAVPELAGQLVAVRGMTRQELEELARACAPAMPAEEVAAAVEAAGGSPWRLRAVMGLSGGPGGDDPVLAGLGAAAAALVRTLGMLQIAVPLEALAPAMALPSEQEVGALERRGIVERSRAGVRLHDLARAMLGRDLAGRPSGECVRVASALAEMAEPALRLEALRLLLESGELERALAHCARSAEELLADGYAPLLWRYIGERRERGLDPWRLRCAVQLGDPRALSLLEAPSRPSIGDELLWAHALFTSGRVQDALPPLRSAHARAAAAGETRIALEAAVLLFEAHVVGGWEEANDARAWLDAAAALDAGASVLRDALFAKGHAIQGEYREALGLAARVGRALGGLRPGEEKDVIHQILVTHLSLGRIRDARELVGRLEALLGGRSLDLFSPRYLLVWRAAIALGAGELEESRALLARLAPFSGGTPALQQPISALIELRRRIVAGALEGLSDSVLELVRHAEAAGSRYFHESGLTVQIQLQTLGAAAEPDPSGLSPSDTAAGHLLRLARLRWALRMERPPDDADRTLLGRLPPGIQAHAIARILAAEQALLRGELETAQREAQEALEATRDLGNRILELEVWQTQCEVLLCAGRRGELGAACATLAKLARSVGSERFVAEAELLGSIATGEGLDPALLERCAARAEVAPTAARRAQALLGAGGPLDAVDRLVHGAIERACGPWRVEAVGGEAGSGWRPGWGLDGRRLAVWLPGGRRVDLSQHALLWRILETLADLGGRASKEDLVRRVWDGERYDPLRHNHRLFPAVSKLRRMIEEDAAHPARLVTTETGYGFGDREPIRRLRGPASPDKPKQVDGGRLGL